MRKLAMVVTCVCLVFAGGTYAEEKKKVQEVAEVEASAKLETIVYPVRRGPVRELMSTLKDVFDGSDTRVVADESNNLLILRVSGPQRDELLKLLENLDRPLRSLTIEMHLLKTRGKDLDEVDTSKLSGPSEEVAAKIRELETAGRIYVANRVQLTAVENLKAMLQVGEQVSVATGATFAGNNARYSNYQSQSVGTIMSVQAAVSNGRDITLALDFEKSEVVPAEGSAGENNFVPASTSSLTQQTTVQLRDGHSVLAGNFISRSAGESEEAYLVVGVNILGEASGKAVTFSSFSQRAPDAGNPRSSRQPRLQPSRGSSDVGRQMKSYAGMIVARYDKNDDGVLTEDEWKSMSRSPSEADADKDGKITPNELAAWLQKNRPSSSSRGR